ncbi:hypothetical protein AAG570_005356 [Ranatra chinensis]|uniref:Uncharacterized protein n=1 Tax=Ranatra chinensis TaxID=642074 RepID=A0ABD0Y073_9HEMI
MASKRRNMFCENKQQETTEIAPTPQGSGGASVLLLGSTEHYNVVTFTDNQILPAASLNATTMRHLCSGEDGSPPLHTLSPLPVHVLIKHLNSARLTSSQSLCLYDPLSCVFTFAATSVFPRERLFPVLFLSCYGHVS